MYGIEKYCKPGEEENERDQEKNWDECYDVWDTPLLQVVEAILPAASDISGAAIKAHLILLEPLLDYDARCRGRQAEDETSEP